MSEVVTKPKARIGRPPKPIPKDIAAKALEMIANGAGLRATCSELGIGTPPMILYWADKDPAFAESYARAGLMNCEMMAEEILDISNEPCADQVAVGRNRNRIDARKWILSKRYPQKYGDKLDVAVDANITLQVTTGIPSIAAASTTNGRKVKGVANPVPPDTGRRVKVEPMLPAPAPAPDREPE